MFYRYSINSLFNDLEDAFYEASAYQSSKRVYTQGNIEKHFKNGILHDDKGPAWIEYDDAGKVKKEVYYLEGEKVSKEVIDTYRQKIEDEKIHHISLGSKTYKVTGKKLKELEKSLGLIE
jgi:hypothetical protein